MNETKAPYNDKNCVIEIKNKNTSVKAAGTDIVTIWNKNSLEVLI